MIAIQPVSTLAAPAANAPLDALRSQIAALVQQYADIAYAPQPFVPGQSAVPVSGKVLGAKELQYMVDASLDGWLTTGRFNAAFEARLAAYLGVKHVLTVNSGSSANLVAFSVADEASLFAKDADKVSNKPAGK